MLTCIRLLEAENLRQFHLQSVSLYKIWQSCRSQQCNVEKCYAGSLLWSSTNQCWYFQTLCFWKFYVCSFFFEKSILILTKRRHVQKHFNWTTQKTKDTRLGFDSVTVYVNHPSFATWIVKGVIFGNCGKLSIEDPALKASTDLYVHSRLVHTIQYLPILLELSGMTIATFQRRWNGKLAW